MKKLSLALCAALLIMTAACGKQEQAPAPPPAPSGTSQESLDSRIKASMNKGVAYLLTQARENGMFEVQFGDRKVPDAGITALCLMALLQADQTEETTAVISNGADFLASLKKEDGGLYMSKEAAPPTYITSVAIMVLAKVDPDKYAEQIRSGQDYLVGIQGKDESDKLNYGGIGYGSDGTANLSTTQYAIEALKVSGYKDEAAFQRAIAFLNRCQNNSETNDMPTAGNDGGFIYNVHSSKAGTHQDAEQDQYKSYGTMTYVGIKSFIYAGVDKSDSRVQNAIKWLQQNYTVEANPGLKDGRMGLYYYFHTMGKTMGVLDVEQFEDAAGIKHEWKQDLAEKIISLQNEDGSWQNDQSRWFENVKPLVTAYSVMALDYCRQ